MTYAESNYNFVNLSLSPQTLSRSFQDLGPVWHVSSESRGSFESDVAVRQGLISPPPVRPSFLHSATFDRSS